MSQTLRSDQISIGHGRQVALYRMSEGARPVVMCHAAPGSGYFDPDPRETGAHDVSLLCIDRPGYGDSSPPNPAEWATPGSAADDIAAVLDGLRIGPVGVAGWSAGGRVALALAARRPDLVSRVAILGTPAPEEEVSWIPPGQRKAVEPLRDSAPDAVHAKLTDMLCALQPADVYAPEAFAGLGACAVDNFVLRKPDVVARLGGMLEQAWKQGAIGLAADIAGYVLRPWGFDWHAVRKETLLLYAVDDPIGAAHGRWWKQSLPNARLELTDSAGHLLIVPEWGRVLNFLTSA
jgi:pimeloyl-ACP methyl ester carboxylesterase